MSNNDYEVKPVGRSERLDNEFRRRLKEDPKKDKKDPKEDTFKEILRKKYEEKNKGSR